MKSDGLVHLIDDDEAVRSALAFLLGTTGLGVRVYESAQDFLDKLPDAPEGCVVSDMRMPGMDGLQLQRVLKQKGIDWPVIIMTGHADVPLAVEAMKAGAVDFIEKPFADEVLISAIQLASDALRHKGARNADKEHVQARMETLSPREKQVLDGLLLGQFNKTIAFNLGLSARTVEVHRANVMAKMGATSLSQLVRLVVQARSS